MTVNKFKKVLFSAIAVLFAVIPLALTAFAFDGEGFEITPCDPFTDFSQTDGQYMWQNPETGSNVLVKVDKKSSNISTLSDEQIEILRDNIVSNYEKLFEEQVSSDVTVTPLSSEKVEFKGHTALKLSVRIVITLDGNTVEETQYMWIFSTKERAFYIYITDNTGNDYENGLKMVNTFSTPDEPLTEKDAEKSAIIIGVIRGVAIGAVVGIGAGAVIGLLKKRRNREKE